MTVLPWHPINAWMYLLGSTTLFSSEQILLVYGRWYTWRLSKMSYTWYIQVQTMKICYGASRWNYHCDRHTYSCSMSLVAAPAQGRPEVALFQGQQQSGRCLTHFSAFIWIIDAFFSAYSARVSIKYGIPYHFAYFVYCFAEFAYFLEYCSSHSFACILGMFINMCTMHIFRHTCWHMPSMHVFCPFELHVTYSNFSCIVHCMIFLESCRIFCYVYCMFCTPFYRFCYIFCCIIQSIVQQDLARARDCMYTYGIQSQYTQLRK